MIRRAVDRFFGLVAIALTRGFHRTVAMENLDAARADGPRVIVVNHFNGFMDVVVMVAALRRLPRFVGKATLRDTVVIRPLLRLAGVVLVQRTVDGAGTAGNVNAFVQCHERLAEGDCIVIFPEGTTHDRESLAPIRTGAARIALGAVTAGVSLVRVVPVGLTYGDKTRLRNAVLVTGGPTIPVGSQGEDDQDAVHHLTEAITDGLGAVVAGVDEPLVAWAIDRAAAVAGREPGYEPSLAERQATARRIARAPEPARTGVVDAVADYTLALDVAGVNDAAVVGSHPPRLWEVIVFGVATWFLGPIIMSVALLNGPAVAAVVLVDRFVRVPVTKGTVRALVAVVLFPATWISFAVLTADGALRVTGVVIGEVAALFGTVWLIEYDAALATRWWLRYRVRVASGWVPALIPRREAVVDAVAAVTLRRAPEPTARPIRSSSP